MRLTTDLSGRLDLFIRLAHSASAPYDRFVWNDEEHALRIARFLVERGTGELAPPAGRVALEREEVIGVLVCLTGRELLRRRLGAAVTLARDPSHRPDNEVLRRAKLAAQTFSRVEPGDYYLARLAVAPAQRGRGWGRELVRVVLEEARAAGSRRCLLEVDPDNTSAITLYRGAGFSVVDEAAVVDAVSGRALRFLRMEANLAEPIHIRESPTANQREPDVS